MVQVHLGYHRYGKDNCTSHRIDESKLDKLIYKELMNLKEEAQNNYDSIEADVKRWLAQKGNAERQTKALSARLEQRRGDRQMILLERLRDCEHAAVYDEMLKKCEDDITTLTEQLDSIRNYEATIKKRKAEIKEGIDMLDEIVAAEEVSDAHLRMLVEEIVINEKKGKLKIKIKMRAKFSSHIDFIPDEDDPMYQNMSPYLIEV